MDYIYYGITVNFLSLPRMYQRRKAQKAVRNITTVLTVNFTTVLKNQSTTY